jgi:hypothetical protein
MAQGSFLSQVSVICEFYCGGVYEKCSSVLCVARRSDGLVCVAGVRGLPAAIAIG